MKAICRRSDSATYLVLIIYQVLAYEDIRSNKHRRSSHIKYALNADGYNNCCPLWRKATAWNDRLGCTRIYFFPPDIFAESYETQILPLNSGLSWGQIIYGTLTNQGGFMWTNLGVLIYVCNQLKGLKIAYEMYPRLGGHASPRLERWNEKEWAAYAMCFVHA